MNATLTVPGDKDATLHYAASHFVAIARDAIEDHGFFAVALSGGSTPKAIYELICQPGLSEEIEWEKVHLFWSDERSVFPDDPESNYRMAMEAGFANMPLLPQHIHRMVAEKDIEAQAHHYETTMRRVLDDQALDLVMLGMGEDGHTASLFPNGCLRCPWPFMRRQSCPAETNLAHDAHLRVHQCGCAHRRLRARQQQKRDAPPRLQYAAQTPLSKCRHRRKSCPMDCR